MTLILALICTALGAYCIGYAIGEALAEERARTTITELREWLRSDINYNAAVRRQERSEVSQ